ncbi:MAG: nicotinate-nucleotide adenylyltransferase [Eubacterium sp.]|nr:nicotinate-nucleotide adenylyltransferase [Eubacterium sp.]
MKIGILGGTFDPIHNAHIEIAENAYKQFGLDKVWIMPTPCPPHKDKTKITPAKDRENMIRLAIDGIDGLEFCDFELHREDPVYSADTLTELKEKYPDVKFYFIIGSDSLETFASWYKPDVIVDKAQLLVVKRGEREGNIDFEKLVVDLEDKFGIMIPCIVMDEMYESSTDIRTGEQALEQSVPENVYKYIQEHNLYKENVNEAWSVAKIKGDLLKRLNQHRYEHTIGVADTAKKMAEAFDVNPNKAYLAGILHDCAKYFDDTELLAFCADKNIKITQIEQKKPFLLHSVVGEIIAKERYHITDEEVLSAIRWHTTGKAEMSDLEKIIFAADYIEPGRKDLPRLDYLREISTKDLDLLVRCILENMMEYLKSTDEEIEEHTLEAYNYYKEK